MPTGGTPALLAETLVRLRPSVDVWLGQARVRRDPQLPSVEERQGVIRLQPLHLLPVALGRHFPLGHFQSVRQTRCERARG